MEHYNTSLSYDEINWDEVSGPVEIPVILGESISDKEFILDVCVELNQNTIIDLELQVVNEGNWTERSLCYLCRSFDNVNRGEDYSMVKPAIHIGLLDFTLFEDAPEFYATYLMSNIKTHQIYSSKLRLSVLNLNHIDLATEEDEYYGIDHWAKLFKTTTWEEMKKLAKTDPYVQEAVTTVYELTQEERIRQQCEAREDYRRRTVGRERMLKEALEEKEQLLEENRRLKSLLQQHGIEKSDITKR